VRECVSEKVRGREDNKECTSAAAVMGWLRVVAPSNYRSLLQNIVCFVVHFCKRDL